MLRSLFLLLLLPNTTTASELQPQDEILFTRYDISLKISEPATLIPGSFLGNAVDDFLLIDQKRNLQLYSYDEDTWSLSFKTKLRSGVQFVDVANIKGQDRLVTVEPGRINWFDPVSKTEELLFELTHTYRRSEQDVPHLDITRDLNQDGLDDLVIPDLDGFFISLQRETGSFTVPMLIGPPEPFRHAQAIDDKRPYARSGVTAQSLPWFLSRVHQADLNLDGLTDLAFWNADHFDVYYQTLDRTFAATPEVFSTDVPFDNDGVYSIIFSFTGDNTFTLLSGMREKTRHTVLQSLQDMTSDGITDLVTFSIEGRSIMRQNSWYDIHPGRITDAGLSFSTEVGMTVRSTGGAGAMLGFGYASQRIRDIDGDGQTDMVLGHVNMGLRKIARAMFGNSVTIDIECYKGKDGQLHHSPRDAREIRPAIEPFSKRGPYFPAVLMGDITGDGRSDLILGSSWEEFQIYLGSPGETLFDEAPLTVTVAMPNDERNARLVDLNEDGKEDLVIHYKTREPHRVVVLLAQ